MTYKNQYNSGVFWEVWTKSKPKSVKKLNLAQDFTFSGQQLYPDEI